MRCSGTAPVPCATCIDLELPRSWPDHGGRSAGASNQRFKARLRTQQGEEDRRPTNHPLAEISASSGSTTTGFSAPKESREQLSSHVHFAAAFKYLSSCVLWSAPKNAGLEAADAGPSMVEPPRLYATRLCAFLGLPMPMNCHLPQKARRPDFIDQRRKMTRSRGGDIAAQPQSFPVGLASQGAADE